MFIHQVYKISNISRLIRLQRVGLLNWSRSFWLIFLGQGFLVIFIEFLFELLPLLEEVQCLNLLPGMPLIEHPVWGHGLPGVNNTAGVVLEDGGVVVLFSPTFPANEVSVQSVLQMVPSYLLFPVVQHFGQNPHIFDTPGLLKPGSQHHSVEPEVPPLNSPALHGPVGLLVEPTDSLGVCKDLSGPDTRHHVWNVSLVMTTNVQMVRNNLWLIRSRRYK